MSRRAVGVLAVLAAVGALALIVVEIQRVERARGLPLSHAAVIRQQAAAKHLDPALIAAVIYAESKFDPRPSSAGAQGLMQILPETALFIAHLSGGNRFTTSDLSTPSINVAYGSYYLRYLLDHYRGNEMLALAAYNGGIANVDSWLARAYAGGRPLTVSSIPFSETRAYVLRVLSAEQEYRSTYPRELGLA
jgi:soluble lytic murein transglycosylase